MSTAEALALCAAAVGLWLLFGELRWFRRRSLSNRLRPYGPPGTTVAAPTPRSSPAAILLPLVDQGIDRATKLLGVRDHLAIRLARADLDIAAATFRSQQAVHGLSALAAGGAIAVLWRPGPAVAVLLLLGAPVLAVLGDEQRLSNRITRRRHVLQLTPTVTGPKSPTNGIRAARTRLDTSIVASAHGPNRVGSGRTTRISARRLRGPSSPSRLASSARSPAIAAPCGSSASV